MSSPEEPIWNLSEDPRYAEAITIPIPVEPDEDWCAMLIDAYAGTHLVSLKSYSYATECRPIGRLRQYAIENCDTIYGEPGRVDGLLVDYRLIHRYNGNVTAFLVLNDVELEVPPYWVASDPEQEFLIPLIDNDDTLIIYPDN